MATVTITPAAQARACFADAFGYASHGVAMAPGRVNLIGEHTDYNDGFVLPLALECGVAVAFARRDDGVLRAHAPAFGETREARLDTLSPQKDGHWLAYVAGVMWALRKIGVTIGGLDLAIASDLPIGAGLSSSAAIEMAVARAACAAGDLAWDPAAMARLGQLAENEYVGVSCGIMDQFASAASVEGHALLLDCRSLHTRPVAIPSDASVVVMDTGVRRALAASDYNARRAACERAVDAVRAFAPAVRALRDVDEPMLARASMDAEAFRRARHVVAEIQRPLAMADALQAHDLPRAGRLMDDSHASLRDLYDVSSPELDAMAAEARRHPACFGARLTGAGFGGCAVALVASDEVEDFRRQVESGYARETRRQARTFASRPARGAHLIE
jgi:galactokinase